MDMLYAWCFALCIVAVPMLVEHASEKCILIAFFKMCQSLSYDCMI